MRDGRRIHFNRMTSLPIGCLRKCPRKRKPPREFYKNDSTPSNMNYHILPNIVDDRCTSIPENSGDVGLFAV